MKMARISAQFVFMK